MNTSEEQRPQPLLAYRRYLDHVMGCDVCTGPERLCPLGRALHRAYRENLDD
ncbi:MULTISPECIES: hypothetical protein [Streptomyces]|uniref:hypothetical protein n=1 Tax=Streptomyces TaxID=1883 RepID=UPI00210C1DB5|nr:hypothetical protein [Streptomyces longispororuber]MCQ4211455.1 hypothetical protein [Streptomyces longispororuber]